MRGPEAGLTAGSGGRASEGIHKETKLRQFRDPREQMVSQYSNVRPGVPDDARQQQPVECTVRVIRCDHQRTAVRDQAKVAR